MALLATRVDDTRSKECTFQTHRVDQKDASHSAKNGQFIRRRASRPPHGDSFPCPPTRARAFRTAADELKMPVPEASAVLVKVTHPCYVSVLRAKLHRSLDIPLADVRYDNSYFSRLGQLLYGLGQPLRFYMRRGGLHFVP